MRSFEFEGIGSHWWIEFDDCDIEEATKALVKQFEKFYSRFDTNSYIGLLNRDKILKDFPLELFYMIKFGEKIRRITDGHFNLCIGSILEAYGYDSSYSFAKKGYLPNKDKLGFVEVSNSLIQITQETNIDLGGIGKGWLIEKIKRLFLNRSIKNFSINGGGDIYCHGDIRSFYLENPFNTNESIGKISISNSAIACSSNNRRKWIDQNTQKEYSHLIDFKSVTDQEKAAVFTKSNSALLADTCSTAIFVSPLEKSHSIAEELKSEFMIILKNGEYFTSPNYDPILNL